MSYRHNFLFFFFFNLEKRQGLFMRAEMFIRINNNPGSVFH